MRKFLEKKRWFVVLGAISIQLALGAIYSWSVFTPVLELSAEKGGLYHFSGVQMALVFSMGLATFAGVMVYAGKVLPRLGPQTLCYLSAMTLGLGYVFAGIFGNTFLEQLLYIGVLGGAGIGLGYVVPIAVGVKWFPDKKGLITGLGVAGFGFGALIWVKWAGSWGGGLLNTFSVLGLPELQSVYLLYGVLFFVLVALGGLFMVNPNPNWMKQYSEAQVAATADVEMDAKEMRSTHQFYMVATVFLSSALAGLMVIYSIKLFGIDTLTHQGSAATVASSVAGTAMASFALFNGAGRIAWGSMSDVIGRRLSVVLMVGLQGITMLATYHIFVHFGHGTGFIVVASIIGFNFGGNFALMPAWTADLFGNKHVGSNYPYIFLAYGVAGIAGPLLAGYFKDSAAGSGDISVWMVPYLVAGVLCLAGATLAAFVTKPEQTTVAITNEAAAQKT